MTIEEMKKALQEPLFDSLIVRHGFAPFLRDYDLVAYIKERQFLYRFSHCTAAWVTTAVADRVWRKSWDDIYTNRAAWELASAPDGYVWATCFSDAYPGATYVENSELAREWSVKLDKQMHEVRIETNVHDIGLIFHDLHVRELQESDSEWVKESPRSLPLKVH